MQGRGLLALFGVAAFTLVTSVASASADSWCGGAFRKDSYNADKAGRGKELVGENRVIDGTYGGITSVYLGTFKDHPIPTPDLWAHDTGTIKLLLTKEKEPRAWFNYMGVTVYICVYKSGAADATKLQTRTGLNREVRITGVEPIGTKNTANISGISDGDFVVAHIVRESMTFKGRLTLDIASKRVPTTKAESAASTK